MTRLRKLSIEHEVANNNWSGSQQRRITNELDWNQQLMFLAEGSVRLKFNNCQLHNVPVPAPVLVHKQSFPLTDRKVLVHSLKYMCTENFH